MHHNQFDAEYKASFLCEPIEANLGAYNNNKIIKSQLFDKHLKYLIYILLQTYNHQLFWPCFL